LPQYAPPPPQQLQRGMADAAAAAAVAEQSEQVTMKIKDSILHWKHEDWAKTDRHDLEMVKPNIDLSAYKSHTIGVKDDMTLPQGAAYFWSMFDLPLKDENDPESFHDHFVLARIWFGFVGLGGVGLDGLGLSVGSAIIQSTRSHIIHRNSINTFIHPYIDAFPHRPSIRHQSRRTITKPTQEEHYEADPVTHLPGQPIDSRTLKPSSTTHHPSSV
jgi:hypothetical protein